jgi:hypothetical protein
MLNELIDIYTEQLKLYNEVSDILVKFDTDEKNLEITKYLKELEDVDKTMDIIKTSNSNLEVLKEKYVFENGLKDFTGEELKKLEAPESYNEFKNIIDSLTTRITDIKRMQDRIISNINSQMDVTKTLLQEVNNSKRAVLSYKKSDDFKKTEYLNKKK